jgi:hypothetical protein
MINRGIVFEPLLGGQGTQFDALKINYIGSPAATPRSCGARKDAAVQSLQDLYSKELSVGGTGSGADTAIYPGVPLSALLGMKLKLVKGYQGSQEIQLAMERNEVQGICLAYDSLSRGNLARNGGLNVLLQAALKRDPRVKGAPMVIEAARSVGGSPGAGIVLCARCHGPPIRGAARPCRRIASRRCARRSMRQSPIRHFSRMPRSRTSTWCRSSAREMTEVVSKAYATPPAVVRRTIRALGRGS